MQETYAEIQQIINEFPRPKSNGEQFAVGVGVAVLGAVAAYFVKRLLKKHFDKSEKD